MTIKLVATNNVTGARTGELRAATLDEVYWELNKPGGATISMSPLARTAPLIELNKTEIQIWIDDVYRHCVIPRDVSGDLKRITFQCEGLLSYFGPGQRHLHTTLIYTSIDQFNIGWNLVNYAQTGTNKSRRITSAPFTPSGRIRSAEFKRDGREAILELLEKFAVIDEGFDFEIKLYGDGRREFTPYYPAKGVVRANMPLEMKRNIVGLSFQKVGRNQATHVWATGGSNGDVQFEEEYEDVALSAEYGVIEKIVSEGSQQDVNWLEDRAMDEVAAEGVPIPVPELIVNDSPVKLDGVLDVGDIVPVRVKHGYIDINGNYRVVKIRRLKSGRLGVTVNAV